MPTAELEEKTGGRSKDLDALAIYTNSFDFTLSPHIPAPGKLSAEAERGKKLFFDKAVGCATCHSGPYYTDSRLKKPFKLHDVGTGGDDPTRRWGRSTTRRRCWASTGRRRTCTTARRRRCWTC